jgi:hypothetical protein
LAGVGRMTASAASPSLEARHSIGLDDRRGHLGHYRGTDDADLDRILAWYATACADAGVELLPDDEARAQAAKMLRLLEPAFAVTFRRH